MATCRGCGARIEFITPSDKHVPVEAIPRRVRRDAMGPFLGWDVEMRKVRGFFVDDAWRPWSTAAGHSDEDGPGTVLIWVSHMARCPAVVKTRATRGDEHDAADDES